MIAVYAIHSLHRNYIYVGMTENLEKRIHQHNSGQNKTTKPYAPFKTILIENYPDRIQARIREKYLKSGVGKAYIKELISK